MNNNIIKINFHQLKNIAQILQQMKNRIKIFKEQLPDGYKTATLLDINVLQTIFNNEFKEEVVK